MDLVDDIEEQIRDALEVQQEAIIQAVLSWGRDRVQSDRQTSEVIAEMLRVRRP